MAQQRKAAPRRRGGRRRKAKRPLPHLLVPGGILLLVALVFGVSGYFFGYEAGRQELQGALLAERQQCSALQQALEKAKKLTASHEYEQAPPQPPKRVETPAKPAGKKPMMAIIFDDVSFAHDVRNIKALHLPVTMSFLPPSKRHPDSAALAAKQAYYMVHLPLEAVSFASEEPHTLHDGDDAAVIEERVRQIKELFPRVAFVNNHTGSKFTADRDAMEKLIYALDREGITFVDSRTTGKTVVPALMKSLHRPYIGRDVFLDHDPEVAAVKKQVRNAVRIAKKYGSVVVIGHPHKKTLQGLAESKKLLEQVQLVRIDTLAAYENHE